MIKFAANLEMAAEHDSTRSSVISTLGKKVMLLHEEQSTKFSGSLTIKTDEKAERSFFFPSHRPLELLLQHPQEEDPLDEQEVVLEHDVELEQEETLDKELSDDTDEEEQVELEGHDVEELLVHDEQSFEESGVPQELHVEELDLSQVEEEFPHEQESPQVPPHPHELDSEHPQDDVLDLHVEEEHPQVLDLSHPHVQESPQDSSHPHEHDDDFVEPVHEQEDDDEDDEEEGVQVQ